MCGLEIERNRRLFWQKQVIGIEKRLSTHKTNYENTVASQCSETQIMPPTKLIKTKIYRNSLLFFFFQKKKIDLARSHRHEGVGENVNIKPEQALFCEPVLEKL